ncbi:Crp/Fnr family transcriptional regulator [Lutibacter citreus]|uniref:Crp/Fnr family transcriptional regulator n=1 Tax=Lutibacter citreus TaxID=2138210 RepID=UPI000DBE1B68|nr:Crp/Fnr family transcriptional regulator [Lutibacter citreus]
MMVCEIVLKLFSNILEKKLIEEIGRYGILKNAEPDQILLEIRRDVQFIPIIVSGIAKVMRRDGKGNGILLHYLKKAELSTIAISYGLQNKKSEIRIKAETNITYIAVPIKIVSLWFDSYDLWRKYYLKVNQLQTSYLIEKINDIAFEGLEFRVLKYIKNTSLIHNSKLIPRKHFDIARDLKVSREAISRTLKNLEKSGVITLGRNKITLNKNGVNG